MHSHCSKKFSCDVTCLRKASRLKSLMKKNRIISMATGNETNRYQVWLPNSYSKAKFWRSGELIILFEIRSPCRNIKENNLSAADSLRISTRFCPLRFHHLNSVVFVLVVLRFFLEDLRTKTHGQSTSRSTCLSVLLVLNELVNMAKKVNLQFELRISA